MKRFSITRRDLLKGAAASAASVGLASCTTAGYRSAARPRKLGPNEKLNIASVGCGGKGQTDIRAVASENIVALCDVDADKAKTIFKEYANVPKFTDYRKMLDEMGSQIDAITVSTPDHMHFPVAKMAMEMGKHVYVQKPLTHSVWEARQMAELARKHGVASQMGNQGQANEGVRVLCEIIWDGAIGPVREAHIWTNRPIWPQAIERPVETPPAPDTLDWDRWLGVAPWRPYNPAYVPFKWRGWYDFGTGALGDMGCHLLAPVFRILQLQAPAHVEADCTALYRETYPAASKMRYEFAARPAQPFATAFPGGICTPGTKELPSVTVYWYDGGRKPDRPEELEDTRELSDGGGALFIGEKGKILDMRLLPESRMREYKLPEKVLPRSIGHYEEWLRACKGGESGGSNFDIAGPLSEAVLLGNVAMRSGEPLDWDSKNLRVTNAPAANEYIRTEYRRGWEV